MERPNALNAMLLQGPKTRIHAKRTRIQRGSMTDPTRIHSGSIVKSTCMDHVSVTKQAATSSHRQPQAATESHRQPQAATDSHEPRPRPQTQAQACGSTGSHQQPQAQAQACGSPTVRLERLFRFFSCVLSVKVRSALLARRPQRPESHDCRYIRITLGVKCSCAGEPD